MNCWDEHLSFRPVGIKLDQNLHMFIHVHLCAENICLMQLFRRKICFVPNVNWFFKIALGKRRNHIFLCRQVHMEVYRDTAHPFLFPVFRALKFPCKIDTIHSIGYKHKNESNYILKSKTIYKNTYLNYLT